MAKRVALDASDASTTQAWATELESLASGLGTAAGAPPDSAIQRDVNFSWQNYGQNLSTRIGTYYLVSNGDDEALAEPSSTPTGSRSRA